MLNKSSVFYIILVFDDLSINEIGIGTGCTGTTHIITMW